ncbi:MAG: MgtC/SapB family protein [bacterium]
MFDSNLFEFVLRIVLAAILGGVIGLERDIHGRAAGLRTHALVCIGSALFMILSEMIATSGDIFLLHQMPPADPTRIAAQIVTGIGFLGAGAILKEGVNITGLTTASCLWVVAAIGMAIGSGQYSMGAVTTIVALIVLVVFKLIDRLHKTQTWRILTVATTCDVDVSIIMNVAKEYKLKVSYFDQIKNYHSGKMVVKLTIHLFHKGITDKLSHAIIKSLENTGIPLFSVKWDHKDMSVETE